MFVSLSPWLLLTKSQKNNFPCSFLAAYFLGQGFFRATTCSDYFLSLTCFNRVCSEVFVSLCWFSSAESGCGFSRFFLHYTYIVFLRWDVQHTGFSLGVQQVVVCNQKPQTPGVVRADLVWRWEACWWGLNTAARWLRNVYPGSGS